MAETVRFGVSLSRRLLRQFDELMKSCGYENRSEAVRDLIRGRLVEEKWAEPEAETFAAAFLVFDHDRLSLPSRLTHLQHASFAQVVGSLHVHIDAQNCLEIVVLRGRVRDVRALGERMISLNGVKYGRLNMGTTGEGLD
jgi:CopG family nickel-responsive transcriptional regulator